MMEEDYYCWTDLGFQPAVPFLRLVRIFGEIPMFREDWMTGFREKAELPKTSPIPRGRTLWSDGQQMTVCLEET